jgi:hypothetical protein
MLHQAVVKDVPLHVRQRAAALTHSLVPESWDELDPLYDRDLYPYIRETCIAVWWECGVEFAIAVLLPPMSAAQVVGLVSSAQHQLGNSMRATLAVTRELRHLAKEAGATWFISSRRIAEREYRYTFVRL